MRRTTLIGLLAACLAAAPSTATADEAGPQYVSFDAHAAVTADVDRDGARELVIVTGAGGRQPTVEVWDLADGTWVRDGAAALVRPAADGSGPFDPSAEALELLAWRSEHGEQALLVIGGDAGDYGGGCCLRLATVAVSDGDGVALQWLGVPELRVDGVHVLDADGDGVDELFVMEPSHGEDAYANLLRWTGDAFEGTRIALGNDDSASRPVHVGETDGIRGDEAVLAVDGGRSLLRVGLDDDGVLVDRGAVSDAPELHLWSWGVAGGSIVLQVGTELRVLTWPRGGGLVTAARSFRPDYPDVFVVGDGPDAIVVDRGVIGFDPRNPPSVEIRDLRLEPIGVVEPAPVLDALWDLMNVRMPALRSQFDSLMPYIGPFPGRLAQGTEGFISFGNLITTDELGGYDVRPMSTLTGLMPVGIAGPDEAWWVLDDGHLGRSDWALLSVMNASPRTVSVVPAADVLAADDGATLDVGLDGAAVVTAEDGSERFVTRGDGFEVKVGGPEGSLVLAVVDQWVVHEGVLPDEPVWLRMESLRARDRNQPIEAAVVRIDPAGRLSTVAWEGEVLREPPDLTVRASAEPFAFRARVSGVAPPGTAVSVDGEPVTLTELGRFHADVDAPIWPRGVTVVARDAVGNEATVRLEVVGVFDYRSLPWAALLAAATIVAGVALFVRIPRRREPVVAVKGDATVVEIDGEWAESDTLTADGRSPGGREA